jgi:hypothetical protein
MRDPTSDALGTLTQTSDTLIEGTLEVAGAIVALRLSFGADAPAERAAAIARARAVADRLESFVVRAKAHAAAQLLTLKNEMWLDEDEEPVTEERFLASMRLDAVAIDQERTVAFWFADGDLFWGHWIEVVMDADDACTSADLHG